MSITDENVEYLPKRVRIVVDTDPTSPRDWDNVGRMVCWHKRYNLGDEQPSGDPQDWLRELAAEHVNAADAERIPDEHVARILEKHFIILPLFLYDHSGLSISCGPFSCPWDSGQVGWVYCTKAKALAECGSIETAEKCMRAEVSTYDDYLSGNVYGFIVEALDYASGDWEHVDSCFGFYGTDPTTNGMAEHLVEPELVAMAREASPEYN